MAEVTKHLRMAGTARFINAAGYTVAIGTAGVARYMLLGAVLLAPSGNMRLMGIMSLPFTAA